MTRIPARPPASSRPLCRTPFDLLVQQLRAIDLLATERAAAEADHPAGRAREARMDAERRLEVLRREHAAVVAQTDAQLRTTGAVMPSAVAPRIVIAHRSTWFTEKVADVLTRNGMWVTAAVVNGADAVGAALSEQPELVLLEDKLVMLPGEEVVREVRRYCPDTAVVAQVGDGDSVGVLLEAGAEAVYTRQVPPAEVAEKLLELVAAGAAEQDLGGSGVR